MTLPPVTRRALLLGAAAAGVAACSSAQSSSGRAAVARPSASPSRSSAPSASPSPSPAASPSPSATAASAAQVAVRATVPVLCWHQLRAWKPKDSAYSRRFLICPPAAFRAQLDALGQSGWSTITPDQYLAHLQTGAGLPSKPVLLSFDDAQGTQATEAMPQLLAREMTATFFAMTVVLGKKGWLSPDDLRRTHAAGMTIGAHTYDHHRVDRYGPQDWGVQLDQPRELLEEIVRTPVRHFAYPYGAWNAAAFPHLSAAGYATAFQLSDKPLDRTAPLETLRRVLVDSTWTGPQLLANLKA